MSGINRDDWLAAVASIEPVTDADALTVAELMDVFGLKETTTKVRLRRLVAAGKATRTARHITDTLGRRQTVTAYRLVGVPHENRTGRRRR